VYVTACDLEKSFDVDNYRPRALSDSRASTSRLVHGTFSEVRKLDRFQTAQATFKVTEGHWHRCHSIGHIRFLSGRKPYVISAIVTINSDRKSLAAYYLPWSSLAADDRKKPK